MKVAIIRDKHLRLDQKKIEMAKAILKAKSETETIERALEAVISRDTRHLERKEIMKRMLARRNKIITVKGSVADWVREGREERDKIYGG